ncbi:lipoyl protein ligase domain-containing protein [Halalkalicoccus jeotgali]|uniref:Biotin/lipoate A/B protein ligase family domain protein n=1 Tax=Halalkalicoccus jeotgali (strain DSM 18796 / CECT 7217 / JCM 14584 / KCTC 4019 / B3) TaxID=795797 RepID=D8J982_HALJB|nr:lipoate--protein ligase family protein [Halalkalicoccus jeotgali]ADJ16351.1 biotin/lipoate A/B protein ligase family domain protein [Halalkalicoccus jeotgali B3]ELY37085.1 biotin/lipoate A/B protein ligase family domain-containing protein [Halalkalicoccus jeotgali B3]
MRVLRGRAASIEADRRVIRELLEAAGEERDPGVRVWTPHRQLAFGRRDTNEAGYEKARRVAEGRGFPALSRNVGGRAVAYTGRTLAFAHAIPIDDPRTGLGERYDGATARVKRALADCAVAVERGEPPNSFCPGAHSLSSDGKVVGIAQRITSRAALVSGIVVVTDREEIAGVLSPVYDALSIPFDPVSVGSVAQAGGPDDPERVARAIEGELVGDDRIEVERIDG